MLRRHRQIKTQIQQVLDAVLFGFSFWLAWVLRADSRIIEFFHLGEPLKPFDTYFWLYLVVIFVGPLILEGQGFYGAPGPFAAPDDALAALQRLPVHHHRSYHSALLFLRLPLGRTVAIMFGVISFISISIKDEFLRAGMRSQFARTQLQRKFILVGTEEETARMRRELSEIPNSGMVVLAELNLNEQPAENLARLLHEHSVNGVILNARHNYFEQVERAIRTCELEGVEVWLIADFFRTDISHASFDDLHGHPVMVFRSTPEASWQGVVKQLIDFLVAFVASNYCFPFRLP